MAIAGKTVVSTSKKGKAAAKEKDEDQLSDEMDVEEIKDGEHEKEVSSKGSSDIEMKNGSSEDEDTLADKTLKPGDDNESDNDSGEHILPLYSHE